MENEGLIDENYEPDVTNVVRRFVREGSICVDAGASIGYFTCLMADIVGPRGLVMAFEPNGPSFEYLEDNIRRRGLFNVIAWKNALWKCDMPTLKLYSVKSLGYTSILHYHSTTYTEIVEARALDSMMPPGIQPNFMKIDCEMAEFPILQGAERALRRGIDCIMVEFNYFLMKQMNVTDHEIRNFMADLGYDMFLVSLAGPGDSYIDPIMVDPKTEIRMAGKLKHINVMFSTEEKVREKWKICDTSKSLRQSAESYKDSLLHITESQTA